MSQKGFLTWGIWEIVAKCDHSAQILLSSSNNRYLIKLSYDSTLNITKIIEVGVLCYIQRTPTSLINPHQQMVTL